MQPGVNNQAQTNAKMESANVPQISNTWAKDQIPNSEEASDRLQITGLERYISHSAVANFGVIILASWESFAVAFQFALANGSPASMFCGSILAGLGACAVGLSLAELASM
ncbi:LPXTG-domain-containing protein [Colletotrichum musicola]|uniref:LPXTG-domain-containing protein n=1 Tax=Colletotrichum musicola TaxID=2175873 RepID=A0A8H6ILN4_9PEZI|nr:LPXTG-domain-containing protein [Colletotrichum musicola]